MVIELGAHATRCETLIKAGRIKNMANKLSALMVFDALTIAEYNHLMELLVAKEKELAGEQ